MVRRERKSWHLSSSGHILLQILVQFLSLCPNIGEIPSCEVGGTIDLHRGPPERPRTCWYWAFCVEGKKWGEKRVKNLQIPAVSNKKCKGGLTFMVPSLDGGLCSVCVVWRRRMMLFRKMPLTFSQSSFFLFLLTSPHPLLLTFMSGTRSTEL